MFSVKFCSWSREISDFSAYFCDHTFGRVGGIELEILIKQRINIKFLVLLGQPVRVSENATNCLCEVRHKEC